MRVAVIGAGAAGLSAAWELSEQGARVTVYEQRAEPGGRLRTDTMDGVSFDPGVQLLASNYTATSALANAAGAGDLIVRSPGRDAVWRKGRAHPLTYGSVATMITSGALPAGLKLKLATRYLPFLARHVDRLDLHDLLRTGALPHDAESIAAWGARELGEDFVHLLAHPLLLAYYGSPPEQTSAALYHALARVGLSVEVRAVRGGMRELPRALARKLTERGTDFRYNARIEALQLDAAGVTVHPGAGDALFDGVIIALPAGDAMKLLPGQDAALQWLRGVRSAPTVSLALVLTLPSGVDYFGLSVPQDEPEAGQLAAICVQERKVPGLVPQGRGALIVLPTPDSLGDLTALSPEELLQRLLPSVERLMPRVRGAIVQARATYFPEGYTLFYAGYVKHLQSFERSLLPSRLALAGDYLVAPTVEGAVRSGAAAARHIMAGLKVT
jgi:protoporphyrinogen/coproporphyrinogen III oxidase